MKALHATRSALLVLLFSVSVALAVNVVYDEVLWTKQIWSSAKVSNMLLYTNPSDQDPKLLEVYPSVRGALANSLDGPNEKRDGSKRPEDTDLDGLDGLSMNGLDAIHDASDIKPASQAAQCSVCHVLMVQVWQKLADHVVDLLLTRPQKANEHQISFDEVKKQLDESCKKEAEDVMLSQQTILKLGEPSVNVMFFVIRERRKGSKPASTAEHKAVRLACKRLVQESGDELIESMSSMLTFLAKQLEDVLNPYGLLDHIASAEADHSSDEDIGSDKLPGSKGINSAGPQTQQLASLVKEVMGRVWAAPGYGFGKDESLADDDDEYEDEDEDDMDPECMDLHPLCLSWADKGECEANPTYMVGSATQKGHCKKSCGVCTPRKKGERRVTGLLDSTDLKAKHPDLAGKLDQLLQPLQQALCNRACGASKACLTGVSGTSASDGFQPNTVVSQDLQQGGWQLEKPHYGLARVESMSAADMAALELSSARHGTSEAGTVAAEVEELLGKAFKNKVLSVEGDFFIYEYVYKNHTRQYHVDSEGRYTEDYLLGVFHRESVNMMDAATGSYSSLEERDLLPNLRSLLMQKDWPYVKQVYAGGNECVLGGGRRAVRKTEVRIACSPDGKLHMLVREPDFCHYIFVIYTPALCKAERFKPIIRTPTDEKLGDDDDLE